MVNSVHLATAANHKRKIMTSLLGESYRAPEHEYAADLGSQPGYRKADSQMPWVQPQRPGYLVISAAHASKGKMRVCDQPVLEEMDGVSHMTFR